MESRTGGTGRGVVRIFLAAALALTAGVAAAPAQAAGGATCGMTVSADYTLRSNLRCSGTAIVVELSEPGQVITLDLGRHALAGDGTGSGVLVRGLSWEPGSVVVRNGTVRGFAEAIGGENLPSYSEGPFALTLSHVTLRDNGSWLGGQARGAALDLTVDRAYIRDSGVSGSSAPESTTTVRRSNFVRSGLESMAETYTYVYDSTFVGGGIRTDVVSNLVAERNVFSRCDVGVLVADSWPSEPTVVRDNVFVGCRVGLILQGMAGTGPNAVTVAGNQFLRNTEDGLRFDVGFYGQVDIVGNRAIGNGGTGIAGAAQVGVQTTLARNIALRNGGHGIDVAGVVDGGGNVARGNATEPQCVGVACTAR